MQNLKDRVVSWIRYQVREARAEGAVLGLSGGLDSSVVGVLCKEALGDRALGLILPCESTEEDLSHALLVAQKFGLGTETVDLTDLYRTFLDLLPEGDLLSRANLKPRLRMATLYYFANSLNYLVVGTGNRTELEVGYFTKHGDGATDILPLGGLYKVEVRRLAEQLGIPEEIRKKPPSAGLWKDQTDEGELGIAYERLDSILVSLGRGEELAGFKPEEVQLVRDMIARSEHKRRPPRVFSP